MHQDRNEISEEVRRKAREAGAAARADVTSAREGGTGRGATTPRTAARHHARRRRIRYPRGQFVSSSRVARRPRPRSLALAVSLPPSLRRCVSAPFPPCPRPPASRFLSALGTPRFLFSYFSAPSTTCALVSFLASLGFRLSLGVVC